MEQKNTSYCRLEIHKYIDFKDNNLNVEENSFIWKYGARIYRENYDDCKSLIQRISQLADIWCNSVTNKEDDEYPSFLIFNSTEFAFIGITPNGWLPPTTRFYGYLLRYFIDIYGKNEYSKYLYKLEKKEVSFIDPAWDVNSVNAAELVSEKMFNILLLDFIEEEIPQATLNPFCFDEIKRKGLID